MKWFLRMCMIWVLLSTDVVHAGYQKEEDLAESVRILLRQAVSAQMPELRPFSSSDDEKQFYRWRNQMSHRMSQHVTQAAVRVAMLNAVDYESRRAGLEPALVLGIIMVESRFQSNAISPVGARGLMQVMPFWAKIIGDGHIQRLFHMRVNVRFGCVIFRHYLDKEKGDVVRALARYNGSLGQTKYAHQVLKAAQQWRY